MKDAAASAYIRELCSLGLASELLIPTLLEALHRLIPSACNLFDWVQPDGSIQRYYFEGPIDDAIARLYFDEFYNRREADAMPKYRDVVRGTATIRSAEELNNRHFFESALYHEIWRPQRLHYRLEAVVRGRDGKPIGSLVLYRAQGDRIFDEKDERTLAALVPYVARGLQSEFEHPTEYATNGARTALVNLDAQGRIVQLSRDAHKLLLLAHGDISPATIAHEPRTWRFPTLSLLHDNLARSREGAPPSCSLTLDNAWGRFEFRADRLEPVDPAMPAGTAVTIHHLVPLEVRVLEQLEAHPLSIVQKKVCALLLQGLTRPQIAARLGVADSTVVDHVRKIYVKLDVHSLDELRARLVDRG